VRKAPETLEHVGDVDLADHGLVEPLLVLVVGLGEVVGPGIADVHPFLVDQPEIDEGLGAELHGAQDVLQHVRGRKILDGVGRGQGAQVETCSRRKRSMPWRLFSARVAMFA
jgi:hypothetical protein